MIRMIDTLKRNVHLLQKRQETTSGNVANVNTFGYKAQKVMQSTLPPKAMHNYTNGPDLNQKNPIGEFVFGNQIERLYRNFDQGALKETGRETDFALSGDAFFTVQLTDGTVGYTRNGNFRLNPQNQLVTQEGYQVLGDNNQPITQAEGALNVSGAMNQLPNFLLSRFTDPNQLKGIGDTLFTSNQVAERGNGTNVQARFLESADVNLADEMVQLIQTAREFDSNQKVIHTADETLRKAANEIGRV